MSWLRSGAGPCPPVRKKDEHCTVAIFGVGLIGGSFALALREAGYTGRILGVSSPATIARAVALGAVDQGLPRPKPLPGDLVFLAQPIGAIIETISAIAASVPPHALVTDAGSTKSAILTAASAQMSTTLFLGGHPMAGSEARGVDAASPNLFRGPCGDLKPAVLNILISRGAAISSIGWRGLAQFPWFWMPPGTIASWP